MINHPSLVSPFVRLPHLKPKLKMGRNEPCWCGSNKKWKSCHKDRERQSPINIFDHTNAMRKETTNGYCSHPNASTRTCSERIIRAHTVQRNGGIAAIAENGHVISVKAAFEDIFKNHGQIVPRKIGVRSASTFMGFCNHHDTEMFRPVETGSIMLTPESCFLFSFRAIAYELFTKRKAIRALNIQREMDKGQPFDIQCTTQEYINVYGQGLRRGLEDVERWKADYDAAYIEQRFDLHRFYGVAFSEILPIVGCGGLYPEFDFEGSPLQKLGRDGMVYEHVTFNLSVLDGRSIAVLGWTEGNNGPAAAFVRSYAKLSSSDKAEATMRLAFEHLENIYIKPSWWNEMSRASQDAAINRMISGLGRDGFDRGSNCLMPDEHKYAENFDVTEEIQREH